MEIKDACQKWIRAMDVDQFTRKELTEMLDSMFEYIVKQRAVDGLESSQTSPLVSLDTKPDDSSPSPACVVHYYAGSENGYKCQLCGHEVQRRRFELVELRKNVVTVINGGNRIISRHVLDSLVKEAEAETWICTDLPDEWKDDNDRDDYHHSQYMDPPTPDG